jgi:hypothetical protein
MSGVEDRCRQLRAAVERHDFEEVEYLAQSATNVWLAGRSACRRLIEQAEELSPYVNTARRLLETNFNSILEQFAHATATIAVPSMHEAIAQLRTTLVVAHGQSLDTDGDDVSRDAGR